MTEWVKRPFNRETDTAAVLYTWIRSYARSAYGTSVGAHHGLSKASDEFWEAHRAMILKLMATSDIEVICDPERSEATAAGPPVIWSWAAYKDRTIHYVLVKKSVRRAGLAEDMILDLLGDKLTTPCWYTFEPVELGRVPPKWIPDFTHHGRKAA